MNSKSGRGDWIRTSDPLRPRPKWWGNWGQQQTAALYFFEEFSASRQREATRGYSRLSAVCQPEIHLADGIQIRSDVISPFAPGIWRP
jgi:hypothetical protein